MGLPPVTKPQAGAAKLAANTQYYAPRVVQPVDPGVWQGDGNTNPARNTYGSFAAGGSPKEWAQHSILNYGQMASDTAMAGNAAGNDSGGVYGHIPVPELLSQPNRWGANGAATDYRNQVTGLGVMDPGRYSAPGAEQIGRYAAMQAAGGGEQDYLRGVASGSIASPAAASAQHDLSARMSGTTALGRGATGSNMAAAQRGATAANNTLGLQSTSQLAALRATDQQNAATQLAMNAGTFGKQDAAMAGEGAKNAGIYGEQQAAALQGAVTGAQQEHLDQMGKFGQGQAEADAYTKWMMDQYGIAAGTIPSYNNVAPAPYIPSLTPQIVGAGVGALGTFGSYLASSGDK